MDGLSGQRLVSLSAVLALLDGMWALTPAADELWCLPVSVLDRSLAAGRLVVIVSAGMCTWSLAWLSIALPLPRIVPLCTGCTSAEVH